MLSKFMRRNVNVMFALQGEKSTQKTKTNKKIHPLCTLQSLE